MDLPKYLYDYVSTSRTKTEQDHKIENLRKKKKRGKMTLLRGTRFWFIIFELCYSLDKKSFTLSK